MTYEGDWVAAMRPFWHVVARSSDVTPEAAVDAELLERRFRLERAIDGRILVDEEAAAEDADQRAVEAYGFVWLCLEREGWERRSVPEIALLDAGTHHGRDGAPFECGAQNLRYVEHLCELVSATVIAAGVTSVDAVSVDGGAWTLQFRVERSDRRPSQDDLDGYDVALPCSVLVEAGGGGPALFVHATPTGPSTTRVFWSTLVVVDAGRDAACDALEELLRRDLPALEAKEPKGLPLDAAPDMRLPQERFSVAYRPALAALGVPSAPSERDAAAAAGRPASHGEEVASRA